VAERLDVILQHMVKNSLFCHLLVLYNARPERWKMILGIFLEFI
jgi:hypothetical protein